MRSRLFASAALALAACTSPPAPPAPLDASPSVDMPSSDAPTSPDAPPTDAPPADAPAAPSCDALGPLPAWAASDAAHRVTLRGSRVHLRVESLADGVLRLLYLRPGESPSARPSWAIQSPPSPTAFARTGTVDGRVVLCTAHVRVEVSPDDLRAHITDATGHVLLDDPPGAGWSADSPSSTASTITRAAPPGERYFGLGEKTGPLDQRGRRLVFWNTDAYDSSHGGYAPNADPLYASVPLLLGLRDGRAWGLFTDNTHRLDVDLARTAPDRHRLVAAAGPIDQYLLAGPALADVIRRYTALTGRTPLPPRWTLGYHQCRWGYSPASRLDALAAEFRNRRIPADSLWLDIQHMRGFRTFTFDPATFPDPAGLATRLAAQGFKLVVIADPGIKQDDAWDDYRDGVAQGVFHRHPDGSLAVGPAWPGASVFPDFTLPAARAWWASRVGALSALGVRGVWLDVNEPTTLPEGGGGTSLPDTVRAHGEGVATTLAEVHNVYAMGEARATYDGLRAASPERRPFVLTRAGYAGVQRHAAMWNGDTPSTWWGLRQTLPMLLNMGLSGLAFVGSDVGGYSGRASPELFARWMQLGALSPFFRGHVTRDVNDQEPWAFGPEVEAVSRAVLQERYRLLPYLYSLFDEARRTGAPPLRAMAYEFQSEPALAAVDDQAMLGPWLLAAPVLEQGATVRRVVLPAGRWYESLSDAVYEGPAVVEQDLTLAALPTFVREGAVIPRTPLQQRAEVTDGATLTLDVYPAVAATTSVLYEDEGDGFGFESGAFSRVTFTLRRTAEGAVLRASPREGRRAPPARAVEVRAHRVDRAPSGVALSGRALPRFETAAALEAAGEGWRWDERASLLVARFADRDGYELALRYDPALTEVRPAVMVPFTVRVPDGTPRDRPVYIATSASGWRHVPLEWTATPGVARGLVPVPRGRWFFYKYSRGDWGTVEKWEGCREADNRYGFGAAEPERDDRVATWADWCPR